MQPYRVETTISDQGMLVIKNIPFSAGEHVEVIISEVKTMPPTGLQYPLRGTPFQYDQPFDSVAEEEWEILQ